MKKQCRGWGAERHRNRRNRLGQAREARRAWCVPSHSQLCMVTNEGAVGAASGGQAVHSAGIS